MFQFAKEARVRRYVSLLCVAAALAVPAQAFAAPLPAPGPGGVADESALASWMFPTDRPRHSKWIFAGAYREAVAGGKTVTTAFAVNGECRVVLERGETVTRCHGRGIGGPLPATQFDVDPALRRARLVLREDGTQHEIFWEADALAPPSGYVAGEACDEGTGQGAGFMRHTSASGNVFDRHVGHAGIDHAILSRGAMLTECTGRSIEGLAQRAAAGETLRLTFR